MLPGATTTIEFEAFYRTHWHSAVRLANALTGSAAAAEDVAQDVFQRMYSTWGNADEPAAYLRVAVVNRCRSYHRHRKVERLRLPLLAPFDETVVGRSELDDVVKALPIRQRAVLVLRYWDDLSEAEIAEKLGCAPGTVKSLASRGRERLAAALAG
ncbi:MAG: SigE family RNA polymerase sigma factor [Actinomycetota bacterium]|nr:SigE family RNA polymerase sigma factor [Actinomycetota bacterium]